MNTQSGKLASIETTVRMDCKKRDRGTDRAYRATETEEEKVSNRDGRTNTDQNIQSHRDGTKETKVHETQRLTHIETRIKMHGKLEKEYQSGLLRKSKTEINVFTFTLMLSSGLCRIMFKNLPLPLCY